MEPMGMAQNYLQNWVVLGFFLPVNIYHTFEHLGMSEFFGPNSGEFGVVNPMGSNPKEIIN